MDLTITKCDFVQALIAEPLMAGSWIFSRDTYSAVSAEVNQGCAVCAVGAALRRTRMFDLDTAADLDRFCRVNVQDRRSFLRKLSDKFEALNNGREVTTARRWRMIKWVADEAPEQVTLRKD